MGIASNAGAGSGFNFFLALTALESGAEVSGVHQLLLVELD